MNMKTFCIKQNIAYKEIKVNNPVFMKFYEINNPENQEIIAIPDGCVDIEFVWKGDEAGAYVCGSLLNGTISRIGTYDRCFGIKFHPGIIPDCFKSSMKFIINNRCELKEFMKFEGMEEALSGKKSLEDKVDFFIEHFNQTKMPEPNIITTYVIQKVREESGLINVKELIDTIGYSHCYTDRVFKDYVGVSIKKYASIIRLQEAIDIIREKKADEVYDRLGYYDQAHFIHDFKRFTSITPNALSKMNEICIV